MKLHNLWSDDNESWDTHNNPIFPLLNRKIVLFTCLLSFFGCTLHLFYTLRNILPEAINFVLVYILVVFM